MRTLSYGATDYFLPRGTPPPTHTFGTGAGAGAGVLPLHGLSPRHHIPAVRGGVAGGVGPPPPPLTPAVVRLAMEGYNDPAARPRRRLAASHFHRMLVRRFFLAWAEHATAPHRRTHRLVRRRLAKAAAGTRTLRLRRRFLAWRGWMRGRRDLRRRVGAFMHRRTLGVARTAFDAIRGPLLAKHHRTSLHGKADALTRRLRLRRGLRALRRVTSHASTLATAVQAWRTHARRRVLAQWLSWAVERRAERAYLSRWRQLRQARALQRWSTWTFSRRRLAELRTAAVRLWRGGLLRRCFGTWVAAVDASHDAREAMAAAVTAWRLRRQAVVLRAWCAYVERSQELTAVLQAALQTRERRACGRMWAAWLRFVAHRRARHALVAKGAAHFRRVALSRGVAALLDNGVMAANVRVKTALARTHARTALLGRVFLHLHVAVATTRRERLHMEMAEEMWRRGGMARAVDAWRRYVVVGWCLVLGSLVAWCLVPLCLQRVGPVVCCSLHPCFVLLFFFLWAETRTSSEMRRAGCVLRLWWPRSPPPPPTSHLPPPPNVATGSPPAVCACDRRAPPPWRSPPTTPAAAPGDGGACTLTTGVRTTRHSPRHSSTGATAAS